MSLGVAAQVVSADYVSPPWWSSWSNCDIAPLEAGDGDTFFEQLPRLKLVEGDIEVTGIFFAGDRPLPVGGEFPDGSFAKVFWQFSERVEDFSISGVLLDASDTALQMLADPHPANSSSSVSAEWSSILEIPEAGCWEIRLSAIDQSGEAFETRFVFVAVE
ncbi:MAG: hypothetical protein M9934_04740 [Thermomicrobiales bacterium]|nr:hypothetical protein [Thermomicrobiales bacterium]